MPDDIDTRLATLDLATVRYLAGLIRRYPTLVDDDDINGEWSYVEGLGVGVARVLSLLDALAGPADDG